MLLNSDIIIKYGKETEMKEGSKGLMKDHSSSAGN